MQLLPFLCRVACLAYSLFRFASSARTRNLVVPAHRSLAMSQSFVVLSCRAWSALNMKILPPQDSFVSTVRSMVRGVEASNLVIYLFLRTCFVSVAPTTLLDVMTVCY
jgi:hypothetical protein